ncbi:MAG: hypothetical protein ACO3YU_07465, partial [Candidatus Nanopelagicales bacterium]
LRPPGRDEASGLSDVVGRDQLPLALASAAFAAAISDCASASLTSSSFGVLVSPTKILLRRVWSMPPPASAPWLMSKT